MKKDIEMNMRDEKSLIEKDYTDGQMVLVYGTLEEVVQYLRDHEDLYTWILDDDPEFILPDFEKEYESWQELEADLDILDHSWWTLEIYDDRLLREQFPFWKQLKQLKRMSGGETR